MKFVMGLDLSLTGSGVCVMDEHEDCPVVETIGFGLKRASTKEELERLVKISDSIISYAKQYNPAAVVIENYAFKAVGRGYQLGELGGVVKSRLLNECEIVPYVVFPTQARSLAFGKGKGKISKEEMIQIVTDMQLPIKFTTDDEMDAWVYASLAWKIYTTLQNPLGGQDPELLEAVFKLDEMRLKRPPKPKVTRKKKPKPIGT